MAEASASAGLVGGLLSFAVARGAPRDALLDCAALSPDQLDDPDNRIPLETYRQLLGAAKDLCGDPALALKWGEAVDMAEISIVGLIMNASRTMADAFAQMQRYSRLAVELDTASPQPRFVIEQSSGERWLVDTRRNPNGFPEMSEISFARLTCGPRRFLDQPHVLEAHFTHDDPGYADEYDRIFQCPVVFSSRRNALRLHPDTPSWPVQLEPGYVFGILTRHADRLLEKIERTRTVRARVEGLLMPNLHRGDFTADGIARELGFSRQTLYRKLRDEGTSFGAVVDELRRNLAMEYLTSKKASVNETAYLLGYADPASFSRAFKRWTGESPREVGGR